MGGVCLGFLILFIMLIMFIISIFAPYVGWWMSVGWKLRDAEPSDMALVMYRVGGVIGTIVVILMMFSL
jgi:hypothetical protein